MGLPRSTYYDAPSRRAYASGEGHIANLRPNRKS